jgi:hypothetical protein
MRDAIIVIDASRVLEGKIGILKSVMHELADSVSSSATRAVSYEMYLSDGERVMTVIQVDPDSSSVEAQMSAAAHIFPRFADLLVMESMDVFGRPSDSLLHRLTRKAELLGLGRPPVVHSREAGFDRLF